MKLQKFIHRIRQNPDFSELICKVRSNISIGIANLKSSADIAAIDGRITIVNNVPVAAGMIKFGACNHTARLLSNRTSERSHNTSCDEI